MSDLSFFIDKLVQTALLEETYNVVQIVVVEDYEELNDLGVDDVVL